MPCPGLTSCLNKIGAAHHWPSSVWIGRKSINLLMSYIKPQITPPSPLIFAILNSGSKRRIILADLVSPSGKPAENTRHPTWLVGGGDAWGEVWFGSFLQRLMVFWWFLQTYMTSGPCSSWFFLVVKSWFFWCYLGLWAMAILCWAAKNSLRGTTTIIDIMGLNFFYNKFLIKSTFLKVTGQ